MGKAQKLIVAATLVAASGVAATFAADSREDTPQYREMVWIPGGEFWMGRSAEARRRVRVRGFWMDATEATNQQFTDFVRATGYVTLAERPPRSEDSPDIPVDKLTAGSIVFTPPSKPVPLDNPNRWWRFVAGANWQHPEGPESDLTGRMQQPVVHVAYGDALAYAQWARKRLPSEAEWEFAARAPAPSFAGHQYLANTFQGHFPHHDTGADGHARAAPVGSFPANPLGLYDMAGNVWEWVADRSFDPAEPSVKKRVKRGESFLCMDRDCARHIAGAREAAAENSASDHTGFRCVRDDRIEAP